MVVSVTCHFIKAVAILPDPDFTAVAILPDPEK